MSRVEEKSSPKSETEVESSAAVCRAEVYKYKPFSFPGLQIRIRFEQKWEMPALSHSVPWCNASTGDGTHPLQVFIHPSTYISQQAGLLPSSHKRALQLHTPD